MSLIDVSLDDKFDLTVPRVFITGTQALVRMCLMQAQIDRDNGLNTAGYVSGYRGSPLGGLDQQFPRAGKQLGAANVIFESALNEDLAATAIWGTQQAELRGEGAFDGVFSMWYGKGPGVDRSGDVFRHGNLAGSSATGGVLVLMGDDHTCESSTTAHQSEYALMDAMIPVLNPCNIEDMVRFGLHGWACSRFAGTWVGLKAVKDNVESSASVELPPEAFESVTPDYAMPAGGLNIRLTDTPLEQEARLHQHKLDAVRAYVKANGLNEVTWSGGRKPSVGIVSAGKSYSDVLTAFDLLGVDAARAEALGVSLMKVGMTWPLEPSIILDFARGLDLLIVVEEKRGLMEGQIKALLQTEGMTTRVIGKRDEHGAVLFQSEAALNAVQIGAEIGRRLPDLTEAADGLAAMLAKDNEAGLVLRKPYFCAGCPHNSSTVVPDGSRAYAGIGCHYMVQFMDRGTIGYTHMGGEGVNWIGESKFTTRAHAFQNIGDGTYNHSGLQAIRAAVATNTRMTFKLLYNDAVAMTGGQGHDGGRSVYDMIREIVAFGPKEVVMVTDDTARIDRSRLPAGVDLHGRERLNDVQSALAEKDGVTVLVYDQTCAAEKRRRRKRGLMEDPDRRVMINDRVCEGCGDCGAQSNCVAILPKETAFGRKRQIDQSACNKDFSCVTGFCPSFVSVRGGVEQKALSLPEKPQVPEPDALAAIEGTYSIALTGIGGTGVVTVGAILGMAAHLEGKGCGIIDMAGLAQKGGAVVSHIQIAERPQDISAIRISRGDADLVLGCDVVTSASTPILSALNRRSGRAVVNTHGVMTGDFTQDPDFKLPVNLMAEKIRKSLPDANSSFVDATAIARVQLGDTIGANMFVLGVAYQRGFLPVSAVAIEKALAMNGVAVAFNQTAFALGRQWVVAPDMFGKSVARPVEKSLEDVIRHCAADLVAYANKRYAKRYLRLVDHVRQIDGDGAFAHAVAANFHKLMAYKDEYEVARHYGPEFQDSMAAVYGKDARLSVHLAPPLLSKKDAKGQLIKREFGPWVFKAFAVLRRMKGVRGTPFDPFGYTAERRQERAMIKTYGAQMRDLAGRLGEVDYDVAVALAQLPQKIRGFGHVKLASVKAAEAERAELETRLEPARAAA